ncbi:nickel-binding protein [Micromonosporaceae bacterium Da 78-11]
MTDVRLPGHRQSRPGQHGESQVEEGVHFEKAWLDPEAGKVFCLSSGPSKEAIMRIHERAGHPTSEVYELTVEV